MSSNLTRSRGNELKISAFVSVALLCINIAMTNNDCEYWPDRDKMFQKSNCTGSVVAVHSFWTEMQCLDNCLRHPLCDKYIFNGQGNQTCQLLSIVDTTGVANLPNTTGACAPHDITDLRQFFLGTQRCRKPRNENENSSSTTRKPKQSTKGASSTVDRKSS